MGWNRTLKSNKPLTVAIIQAAVRTLPLYLKFPELHGMLGKKAHIPQNVNKSPSFDWHLRCDVGFNTTRPRNLELHGAYGMSKEPDLLVAAMTESLARRLEKRGFKIVVGKLRT